jgi:hypothetical protein
LRAQGIGLPSALRCASHRVLPAFIASMVWPVLNSVVLCIRVDDHFGGRPLDGQCSMFSL